MDDKFECRGKWFLLIISTHRQLVKFCDVAYLRRILKMSTMTMTSKIRPIIIIAHAQAGGMGVGGADNAGTGADSVRKLKVADQSLGTGSRAITLQKYAWSYSS